MLQIFYNGFQSVFQVFLMHVSSVSTVFRHMLQVLCLDILKVDRMLHLSPRFLLLPALARHPLPPPPLLDAGGVRGSTAARGHAKRGGKQTVGASVRMPRPGASKAWVYIGQLSSCQYAGA